MRALRDVVDFAERRCCFTRERGTSPPYRTGRDALVRAALREALQAVVRDRLPGCRVGDVLPVLRPDSGIAVECPEPDAHRPRLRVAAPERAATGAAEALGPAVRRRPLAYQV